MNTLNNISDLIEQEAKAQDVRTVNGLYKGLKTHKTLRLLVCEYVAHHMHTGVEPIAKHFKLHNSTVYHWLASYIGEYKMPADVPPLMQGYITKAAQKNRRKAVDTIKREAASIPRITKTKPVHHGLVSTMMEDIKKLVAKSEKLNSEYLDTMEELELLQQCNKLGYILYKKVPVVCQ